MAEEKYNKLKGGIKSLTRIAKNKLKGVDDKVPEQVKQNRLAICNACPKLNQFLKTCKVCGCNVNLKSQYREESCPEGKWKAYEEDES